MQINQTCSALNSNQRVWLVGLLQHNNNNNNNNNNNKIPQNHALAKIN